MNAVIITRVLLLLLLLLLLLVVYASGSLAKPCDRSERLEAGDCYGGQVDDIQTDGRGTYPPPTLKPFVLRFYNTKPTIKVKTLSDNY